MSGHKHLSVIIVPHDDSKTRNYRLSYRMVYLLATLVGVVALALIVFVVSNGQLIVAAERTAFLDRENARLRTQVAQVDSLKLELINLHALSIQIKGMLGVELSPADSLLVANLSPDARSSSNGEEEVDVAGAEEQQQMLEALPSMWPVNGYVTREFHITGGETNPRFHPGIDIAADRNTPIRAAADGVVESSYFDETLGWMVKIDHGYAFHTVYGHNTRNLVEHGDRVTRGTTIAFVGNTGKSTAPHVHFEVRKNGVPVDPRAYLLH